jgi:spore coat protein CotH
LLCWSFAAVIAAISSAACSRSLATATAREGECIPGTYHACNCANGDNGIRSCSANGAPMGGCDCEEGSATKRQPLTVTTAGAGSITSPGKTGQNPQSSAAAANRGAGSTGLSSSMSTGSIGTPSGGTSPGADADGGIVAKSGVTTIEAPMDEASFIFDPQKLRTFNIIVAQADLSRINAMPSNEQLVPAMVEFEGKSYGPYKVRYKGSTGSFQYPCTMDSPSSPKAGKCSMKLDFNDTDPTARFFGLKKLNFHSMNADTSLLRDRLGYELFREMGVASPRAVHARVLINGELEGLFIAVEQIDGRFTRSTFSDGGQGNLYKEVWPMHDVAEPYLDALESKRDNPPNVQAMLDFKKAIDSGAGAAESFIDRDYTLRYLAVDRLIINDDGALHFWCNDKSGQGGNPGEFGNHNYFWYEEAAAPRFWLIPWDLDHSFDNSPAVHLDTEWTQSAPCVCQNQSAAGMDRPASCDPLVADFISWLPDYEQRVDEFVAGPLAKAHVDAILQTWSDQIRSAVTESAGVNLAPDVATFDSGVSTLITKIDSARAHRGYAY